MDSLCRRERLLSKVVERAFRSVDRAKFVEFEDRENVNYVDEPYRNTRSNLHISAPHIYVTAAQALDLEPGLSFLNIGSGSGYFSAVVSTILGSNAISHGIELRENFVTFSKRATQTFLDSPVSDETEEEEEEEEVDRKRRRRTSSSSSSQSSVCAETIFFQGDIFKLDIDRNIKYDRIYVGAEAPRSSLLHFCKLLNPNGVLVGPFDGIFLKAKKLSENDTISTSSLAHVSFVPLTSSSKGSIDDGGDFCNAKKEEETFIIASNRWNRADHKNFPLTFRKSVTSIMACVSLSEENNLPPIDVWTYILEFLSPHWFEKPVSKTERLHKRLKVEVEACCEEAESNHATTMYMVLHHPLLHFFNNRNSVDDDDSNSSSSFSEESDDDGVFVVNQI